MTVLTLEFPSGRVVAFRSEPNVVADWILARQLPSGERLLGERYEQIARALAKAFDLRRVDDAYPYHFFGPRRPNAPRASKD